jgi:hypothetical protein
MGAIASAYACTIGTGQMWRWIPAVLALLAFPPSLAGQQPVFGTYEMTMFGRNTKTGAQVVSRYVLVLADSQLPAAVLNRLPGTDPMSPRSPAHDRVCWRRLMVPGMAVQVMNSGRTDWRMVRDSVLVSQWFSTDAGTSFLFRTDSAGLRGFALSTGWMPAPSGRNEPMNLRDSIIGVRVGRADPARCLAQQ